MNQYLKTFYKIVGITALDFILIWVWVYNEDPDTSVSIAIVLLVPFAFVINLIIAGVLHLFKKKEFCKLFFWNSFIASVIMYFLFLDGIDRHNNRIFESWSFTKNDTIFDLTRWKETNEFSMSYSDSPGSSTSFLSGKCQLKKDEWFLTNGNIHMKIKNDYLIGFRTQTDTIKMKKEE